MNRIIIATLAAAILPFTFPDMAFSQDVGIAQDTVQTAIQQSARPSGADIPLINKFKYYDDGKVMSCSKWMPNGNLAARLYYYRSGKIQKVELYDRAGNKIEEANYDDQGRLYQNFDGWAAKRWIYKDGNLRVEASYGEDGHITERKIYNESGDLVDRQYVGDGDNIDPDEEFNRGSIVTHETDQFYNQYGDQTGSFTTEIDDPDDMLGDLY